jgi:hypothetical protein
MPTHIHLVYADDGDQKTVIAAFTDKRKAEKYRVLQKKLDDSGINTYFVISEKIMDKEFDLNTTAGMYYAYYINSDDSIELADDYNDKTRESHINKGEEFVEVQEYNEYSTITGFSQKSYIRAKELAIQKYKEINKCS